MSWSAVYRTYKIDIDIGGYSTTARHTDLHRGSKIGLNHTAGQIEHERMIELGGYGHKWSGAWHGRGRGYSYTLDVPSAIRVPPHPPVSST